MSDNEIHHFDLEFISDEDEELEYPDTFYLPILFVLDKLQRERMWKIWVIGDTVHRLQGIVTGKKQTYTRTYKGKNIGRKNETSSEEQAKQSAETMWIKQLDKGYLPKCKEGKAMFKRVKNASEGGHNMNAGASIRGRKSKSVTKKNNFIVSKIHTEIKPMKAATWDLADPKDPKSVLSRVTKYFNFDEGVYLQLKLDGWRCVARKQRRPSPHGSGVGTPEIVLTTNSGKQYPWFSHLREELLELFEGNEKLILDGLDGEVYTHCILDNKGEELDEKARFQTIQSICGLARSKPHELETQLGFVVFDLVDLSGKYDQDQRFARLKKLFKGHPTSSKISMCRTKVANFIEEVYDFHDEVAQEGYEGVIIRSRDLTYTQKRSLRMRKYKYFIDREYPIVDVKKNDGVADEHFVWVCHDPEILDPKTGEPRRFKAKPMGSAEDKVYWYSNYLEYLGKPLTVKFQEYLDSGVPRFPIAKGIREEY